MVIFRQLSFSVSDHIDFNVRYFKNVTFTQGENLLINSSRMTYKVNKLKNQYNTNMYRNTQGLGTRPVAQSEERSTIVAQLEQPIVVQL